MGKSLLHLTIEQLAEALRGRVPDWEWAEHMRTCHDCRRELASSLLIGGLMRSKRSVDGSDHLSSMRIREVHAAAFEFEFVDQRPTKFIAALQHMERCDTCYAKFFALHESLAPSERAVSGAIALFTQGQSKRKAGTLRITRSFERLAQAFDSLIPPDGPVGLLRQRISATSLLMPGRPDDIAHGHESSRVAMSESSVWDASAVDPAYMKISMRKAQLARRAREPLPVDGWLRLEMDTQSAKEALEEIVGQLQNLREAARAAELDGDDERLVQTLDNLNQLRDRFASVTAPIEELRVQFPHVLDKLHQHLVEVRRRNQETQYETEPEMIVLPGLALSVVAKWRGRSGDLEISAVDSETREPRRDVEITPVATKGVPLSSIITNASGRAVVPLGQHLVGLEIAVDPADRPWVIDIVLKQ